MSHVSPGKSASGTPPESRLDSWKEIAAYLGRDVTTVQRWEKREAMPVHRHLHDKRGSVYAVAWELDAWQRGRKPATGNGLPEAIPDPEVPAGVNPERKKVLRPAWWLAVAGLCALTLVVAAILAFRGRSDHGAPPKIRSLAVLPLKNMTGDPSQEYLADGMTDALIGRLAGIHDLRVISRTSVMQFKDARISVPEIAERLGVDAVVEGSVMREGNHLRVTVRLIRAARDEHFWSETYDRELRDVFSLQSELAQTIAEKVQATVTGAEQERLAAARPVEPGVYESYSRGEFALYRSTTKADLETSIGYFEQALKEDPTFAPAYVGLANAYTILGTVFVGGEPEQMRSKVMSAAQRALELDPNLAEAHVLRAKVLQEEWHWTEAEAEYRRALELNPNSAAAYEGLGMWLACHGRADEAVAAAERGRELDPLAVSFEDLGWILFQTRHYEQGIRELRAALADRPDDFVALTDLGFVLIANGQPADAVPVLEKAAAVSNRAPGPLGVLVRAYAHAGRRADALRILAELQSRRKQGYIPAGAMVNAYLGIGDDERAFDWLEKAYQEQSNILQFLKAHPYFDPIRKDSRFADLMRRVSLS